jgi:putative spermidine/putrescine transport system substrate-binding protein
VPYTWTANALLVRRRAFPPGTSASLRSLFEPGTGRRLAMLDSPLEIAAAARYLGSTSPFSLSSEDLASALELLRLQRPLVGVYAGVAGLRDRFAAGDLDAAVGPPAAVAGVPGTFAELPSEGTIGWIGAIAVVSEAPDPVCAYRLLSYVLEPGPQVVLARASGGAPVLPRACRAHGAGLLCSELVHHGLDDVSFAPPADPHAVPFRDWVPAWRALVAGRPSPGQG